MHSVASSRRDSRSGGDGLGGLGSSKKVSKGVFGSRVNASEQARDVERMNAEVGRCAYRSFKKVLHADRLCREASRRRLSCQPWKMTNNTYMTEKK